MSDTTDAQRAEEAMAGRIERAKESLRFQQRVLCLFVEGLGPTAIAVRLGRSRSYVIEVEAWLGLRVAAGRRRDRRARLEEVHP